MLARMDDGAPITGPLTRPLPDCASGIVDSAVCPPRPNGPCRSSHDRPPDLDAYSLKSPASAEVAAPDLPYRPPMPRDLGQRIALIGAGGISAAHLAAYRSAGFNVAVICSRNRAKAEARRDEYFPDAEATDDVQRTLARDDIAVVDLTPHPAERLALIQTALLAGKHVLSQKPFVLDLNTGQRLVDLAEEKRLVLAVNQNGRWAPHLAWIREAVRAGLIGEVQSCCVSIHWDHSWIGGTAFEQLHELVLYDFAVHWFDFLASLISGRATTVFAATNRAAARSCVHRCWPRHSSRSRAARLPCNSMGLPGSGRRTEHS
jgi:hypothetical protein